MGFTEETFLFLFLPVSILAYLIISRFKSIKASNINIALIAMSLVFYAWSSLDTLLLFLLMMLLTYLFGTVIGLTRRAECRTDTETESGPRMMAESFADAADLTFDRTKTSRIWLAVSIILILLPLLISKYTNFVLSTVSRLTGCVFSIGELLVPLGISFVTFECLSYLIDIYRGDAEAGGFPDFALFLSLFPKIVSGPIVLWRDFAPQLANREVNTDHIAHGLGRIIIGYAEKAILADTFGERISEISDMVMLTGIDTPTAWLRSLLYFFELYYDFSGYSQIAIGLCEIFGFDIKENFHYPYISTSVSEFWRRWHISLGSWFREYVYIPLGGNRRGNVYLHLFTVFFLTGIWHGASWNFIAWGLMHGLCVMWERAVRDRDFYKKTPKFVKWLLTMTVVFFAWVLFMSNGLSDAMHNYRLLFTYVPGSAVNYTWRYFLTRKIIMLLVIAAFFAFIGAADLPNRVQKCIYRSGAAAFLARLVLLALFVVDILFIVNSTYSPFMYFRF